MPSRSSSQFATNPSISDQRLGSIARSFVIVVVLAIAAFYARAEPQQSAPLFGFFPSSWFLQAGTGRETQSITVGATWDFGKRYNVGGGDMTTYVEASLSAWSYETANRRGRTQLAQIAAIPVLRYRPDDGQSPWFFEGGIGATVTSKVYLTREKRFSTAFNFGTHLAVGVSFGQRREHEVSLRVEHFSNGGIKRPNPGENFLQIRYVYRFT